MSASINRRTFLGAAAASSLSLGLHSASAAPASDKIVVGVMGTGGRGTGLAKSFAQQTGATVAYVCDVDEGRAGKASEVVGSVSKAAPKVVTDFRRILEDKDVDVLVVATCNHWHAPAAILGCTNNKHVYVEKPCSYNPQEGELLVQSARKNKRQVQMGNQRRSWAKIIEGITRVRDGVIGRAYLAQSWYTNSRGTIGKGKPADVPKGLDYALWQGPAPAKPFQDNYLHYNWHWFWHWGNGELGNNGVHMIDLCRWALAADYPNRVTSTGGRYRYDDDQETPDTHQVSFEFEGKKSITWEGLSCNLMPEGQKADVIIYGEKGSVRISGAGYTIHDLKGKEIERSYGDSSDASHLGNFLAGIRESAKLNSEIEEAYKSTLLCHLGNISHRTGRALKCNPKDGRILNDKEAMALWTREYAKGWEPVV
ncbi:MAG: Gfo/Idh/MocA family oxidoreductase [Planctomycetes bacterium]|nr:Gfo/Idh/MocA family oxidoreductase [Planctomycetota bacterium]